MAVLTLENEKKIKISAIVATIAVCGLVTVLNQKWIPHPDSFPHFIYSLPLVNAILNGTCSVLLVISLFAIKKRNIELHKKLNLSAFVLSALFLISYVTAHYLYPTLNMAMLIMTES